MANSKNRDNCQICLGLKGGVLGNENRVYDIVMCDYCTVATEQLILNVSKVIKEKCANMVEEHEILDYDLPNELAAKIRGIQEFTYL